MPSVEPNADGNGELVLAILQARISRALSASSSIDLLAIYVALAIVSGAGLIASHAHVSPDNVAGDLLLVLSVSFAMVATLVTGLIVYPAAFPTGVSGRQVIEASSKDRASFVEDLTADLAQVLADAEAEVNRKNLRLKQAVALAVAGIACLILVAIGGQLQ